jgi:RNA polymerase sigma factor (sigma-70 family)
MSSTQLGVLVQHLRKLTESPDTVLVPDRQLLDNFLAHRDESSFAELVRRHGPMVLNVCRGVLHNRHDAEDVFQATFLVLARKAASIRHREAVGGWLCEVAYRLARKEQESILRRRDREERTGAPAIPDPLLDMTLRELHQVMMQELHRLPEKYRLPLVLCYLEGRTQAEAARQLGWPKDVVRGRLNRARVQLRVRLTRRGLALTAGFFTTALAVGPAPAALPALQTETLARAVLASAAGQAGQLVSERVAALAEGAARTLSAGHGKIVSVLLLALGLLTAGAGLWARNPFVAPAPLVSAAPPPAPAADKEPPKATPARPGPEVTIEDQGDSLAVSGRVLDPDGKPLAGAEITLWWHDVRGWVCWHHPAMHDSKPYRGTRSGKDGCFHFTFAKSAIRDTMLNGDARPWHRMAIVAAAPGYGPAWLYAHGLGTPDARLQMVKDDVPIIGRVRDLQGRPVAGATVRLHRVEALDRDAWAGPPAAVTTDEQGRFRLTGAGRDRGAVLIVSGPRIETKIVQATTRTTEDGKPVDVIAGPSKPIEGTVRAKDTGNPLAGVWVYCNEHAYCNNNQVRLIRAVTDEKGHYRLEGMPKSSSYELTVYAPAGQPYLDTARTLADSEGLKPIVTDFALRRGVPVKFRLLDKRTGRPVRGKIQYEIAQDNPLYAEAVYGPGVIPSREFMHIRTTDQDDYIRFIAYPGPCAIFAVAGRENGYFLRAKLDPVDEAKGRYPLGKGDPGNGFLGLSHGYRCIDYPENAREQTFDILFDSGVTLKGVLVGPDSQPVKGAVAHGLSFDRTPQAQSPEDEPLPNDTFVARGLDPDGACTLSFVQRQRELIGHVVVHGNEKQAVTAPLRRWGVLTGRLVDADGRPLPDVRLSLKYPDLPQPGMRPWDQEMRTDRDGRFRVEGLLPDLDHELALSHDTRKDVTLSAGEALKQLKTRAGEVKDLGDIAVKVAPVPKTEKKDG